MSDKQVVDGVLYRERSQGACFSYTLRRSVCVGVLQRRIEESRAPRASAGHDRKDTSSQIGHMQMYALADGTEVKVPWSCTQTKYRDSGFG